MAFPLAAASCPAPQVPGALEFAADSYLAAAPPNHFLVTPGEGTQGVYSGMSHGLAAAAINMYLKCVEQLGRYGSGSYAILSGFTYTSAAGLVITVAPGLALVDCPVESKVSKTITVADNTAAVWVWLLRNGNLASVNNSTAAPGGGVPGVPLFVVTTSGGAVTAHDTSGVCYLRNGGLWRTTADDGAPNETPNASLRLYTETNWFTYFWDGTSHNLLRGHQNRTTVSLAGGSVVLSKAQARAYVLELTGLLTGNVTVEFPKVPGVTWAVYNNTTGAFTVTLKNNGGAGVAITQTKKATYYSDGTDMVKVTAEI